MGMTSGDYLTRLISRCYDAAEGLMSEAEVEDFVNKVIGEYSATPVVGKNVATAARNRDWKALASALGTCMTYGNGNKAMDQ